MAPLLKRREEAGSEPVSTASTSGGSPGARVANTLGPSPSVLTGGPDTTGWSCAGPLPHRLFSQETR